LSGVQVEAVLRGGEIVKLGATNESGRVRVSKNELREQEAIVLLICKEYYFCGALRLDQEDFFEYDERSIHLAPFGI